MNRHTGKTWNGSAWVSKKEWREGKARASEWMHLNTEKRFVVVVSEYSTSKLLNIYGPLTEREANDLSMALPGSSTRDYVVTELQPPPTFDFADVTGRRGAK